MEKNLEKSLKRFLKRKVKITLGFIVAFLLSCNFVSAVDYELEITLGEEETILFNKEIFDEKTHQFIGNTFKNNLYTNNNTISGIKILKNKNISLNNMGSIINKKYHGICNNDGAIEELNNSGMISSMYNGIHNLRADINTLKNSGVIYGHNSVGISITGEIGTLDNKGTILGKSSGITIDEEKMERLNNEGVIYTNSQSYAISIGDWDSKEEIGTLSNKGIISNGNNCGLFIQGETKLENLDNIGIISGEGDGIHISSGTIDTLSNKGIISGGEDDVYYGIRNLKTTPLKNYGIIGGGYRALSRDTNYENYGLLINGDKIELGTGKDNLETKDIINGAKVVDKKTIAKAINSSELSKKENLIINVVGDIDTAFNIDKDLKISDSIINGYKNSVILNDGAFEGDNIIVNAGENAFIGSGSEDSLKLSNSIVNGNISLGTGADNISFDTSTLNGKVDLGAGIDTLTLGNNVQINGDISGGEDIDTLTFGLADSTKSLEENNTNILYNISGFENINVNNNITLFENTKVTGASDITIGDNGNLILRIDGTNNNSHALLGNSSTISSTGGKLLIALNGVGEGAIISLGDNKLDETILGNEIGYAEDITLDTTSLLHNIKKESESSVKVETIENLPEKDIPENINYDKINKIYQSIRSIDKVGEFNIDGEEKLTAFTKYLHDIYGGNLYVYSSELSRKTMDMMKNLADRDLRPDYKEWAIYGGFTHVDGGTENTYYGKGYYTYDIGSRDILADTKISGGYFKAEYGKSDTVTTGIVFGGNNSEVSLSNGSKLEGDSFYFGTYAKKYLNNFRFTLGAGFEHGDYKGERTAIGYDGITETRKYNSNYHDRGFNIYADTKYSKEFGNGFFIEPSITLEYSYIDQDGAKEEDGSLAIETDSKNFDYITGIVNLNLRKEFEASDFTHSLIAGVSYERMLSGYDEEYITGRMKGGTDFDILVPEKEKDIFSLNAKYELETEKGFIFDLGVSYRFEHSTDKDQWIVGTGVGYKF